MLWFDVGGAKRPGNIDSVQVRLAVIFAKQERLLDPPLTLAF